MKTAITVLQEMMMKLGQLPEYECISQSGPQHQATFEYRCMAHGEVATAAARSKKEAKQEAARALLLLLAARGLPVPPPFAPSTPSTQGSSTSGVGGVGGGSGVGGASGGSGAAGAGVSSAGCYVMLLKELCEEYRMPAVDYELVGDTGPPHMRLFTMRATIGQHARHATATTKRAARNAASELLYSYLREHLRVTKDFVEEAALARGHEKVMERWREARATDGERPRLEQRLADYHLGLQDAFDAEKRAAAGTALAARASEAALEGAARALGLRLEWTPVPRRQRPPLVAATLAPTAPPLAFLGETRERAAAAAVAYMRAAMPTPASAPDRRAGDE